MLPPIQCHQVLKHYVVVFGRNSPIRLLMNTNDRGISNQSYYVVALLLMGGAFHMKIAHMYLDK